MKGFFEEKSGLSMTRLLSMLTCLTGLGIGVIVALKGNANVHTTSIAIGFVSAGLGIKILQKAKEK